MKLTLLVPLLASLSTTLVLAARAPPNCNPMLEAIKAKAFAIMDLEGFCAKQACESLNPSNPHLCEDPSKMEEYRASCAEVLRRSNLQHSPAAAGEVKIAPDVERKLRGLTEKIKGFLPTQMDGGEKGEGNGYEGKKEGLGLKEFAEMMREAGDGGPGMGKDEL